MEHSTDLFVPNFIKVVSDDKTAGRCVTLKDVFEASVDRQQLILSQRDIRRILVNELNVNFKNATPEYVNLFRDIFLLTWERWNVEGSGFNDEQTFRGFQLSLAAKLASVLKEMERFFSDEREPDARPEVETSESSDRVADSGDVGHEEEIASHVMDVLELILLSHL